MCRVLIMGLPGAGKTTLAQSVVTKLGLALRSVTWLNADEIRKHYQDWDFSKEGRIRQSVRMRRLADNSTSDFVICDFVAPLQLQREVFEADLTIWVDTISAGRFEDTNKTFVPPHDYDLRVTEQDADKWSRIVVQMLLSYERDKQAQHS